MVLSLLAPEIPRHAASGSSWRNIAAPLIVIYLLADVGSIFGGWLSGALIKRGWNVNAGRKTTMLIAALLIVPTVFAPYTPSMWTAVLIVGVAAAAHQWWSANIFTLASDMFPRYAVGSVVGIGGFTGAIGWFLLPARDGLGAATQRQQLHADVPRLRFRVRVGAASSFTCWRPSWRAWS